jgi:benzoyl-CoA reductase/2-hydroxyglutaryl-CoA dehydratase subunit BcrC/BadD/HgdB
MMAAMSFRASQIFFEDKPLPRNFCPLVRRRLAHLFMTLCYARKYNIILLGLSK